MKTFKELRIGETFFMVYTNYQGIEKPKWVEITVKKIEIDERNNEKFLMINRRPGYHGGDYCDFIFPVDRCNINTIESGNEGYFTTEKSVLVKLISRAGLKYIREIEAEIRAKEDEIKRIRIAYWDYLNNLTDEPLVETEIEIG